MAFAHRYPSSRRCRKLSNAPRLLHKRRHPTSSDETNREPEALPAPPRKRSRLSDDSDSSREALDADPSTGEAAVAISISTPSPTELALPDLEPFTPLDVAEAIRRALDVLGRLDVLS